MRLDRTRSFSQAQFGYCVIQRNAASTFQRRSQALTHGLGFQQIGSFALGSDFLPKRDGNNDRRGLTSLIGHDLNIGFGHSFILTPLSSRQEEASDPIWSVNRPESLNAGGLRDNK
jgi:hypothetical protein